MKSLKPILLLAALLCVLFLAAALYLQIVEEMAPCPLCIIQRYVFVVIAIVCLLFALLPAAAARFGAGLAGLLALCGIGAASWHMWVKAHPGTSCGVDPMETTLNHIAIARMFPTLFQADGLCTTDYGTTFGLTVPQWSFAAFLILAVVLWGALARRR